MFSSLDTGSCPKLSGFTGDTRTNVAGGLLLTKYPGVIFQHLRKSFLKQGHQIAEKLFPLCIFKCSVQACWLHGFSSGHGCHSVSTLLEVNYKIFINGGRRLIINKKIAVPKAGHLMLTFFWDALLTH